MSDPMSPGRASYEARTALEAARIGLDVSDYLTWDELGEHKRAEEEAGAEAGAAVALAARPEEERV